jgi:hypothetical protein
MVSTFPRHPNLSGRPEWHNTEINQAMPREANFQTHFVAQAIPAPQSGRKFGGNSQAMESRPHHPAFEGWGNRGETRSEKGKIVVSFIPRQAKKPLETRQKRDRRNETRPIGLPVQVSEPGSRGQNRIPEQCLSIIGWRGTL